MPPGPALPGVGRPSGCDAGMSVDTAPVFGRLIPPMHAYGGDGKSVGEAVRCEATDLAKRPIVEPATSLRGRTPHSTRPTSAGYLYVKPQHRRTAPPAAALAAPAATILALVVILAPALPACERGPTSVLHSRIHARTA